jgi:hypothetical protein
VSWQPGEEASSFEWLEIKKPGPRFGKGDKKNGKWRNKGNFPGSKGLYFRGLGFFGKRKRSVSYTRKG